MSPFRRPMPQPDDLSAEFWARAREGVIVIQRCDRCSNLAHPPVAMCTACVEPAKPAFSFVPVSGQGRLVSWTVVRRALVVGFEDHVPFVYALVELVEQEGLHMAAELVVDHVDYLAIGLPVEVVFDEGDEVGIVPCFQPVISVDG